MASKRPYFVSITVHRTTHVIRKNLKHLCIKKILFDQYFLDSYKNFDIQKYYEPKNKKKVTKIKSDFNKINLRFDGTNFVTAASSNHPHRYSSLGKMNEGLIAISGYPYQDSSVEVELFANGNWYNQPPFQEEEYFRNYSTATYQNILYVFGEFFS